MPEKILAGLPNGYDLLREIANLVQGLRTLTVAIRAGESVHSERTGSYIFIARIDSELYRSVRSPDQAGNRSRRRYLLQSCHIFALTYVALVTGSGGTATELFLYRFENGFTVIASEMGAVAAKTFRSLLAKEDFRPQTLATTISELIDVCVTLDWSSWRDISGVLLDFFLCDPSCHGQLQQLWKERMACLSK